MEKHFIFIDDDLNSHLRAQNIQFTLIFKHRLNNVDRSIAINWIHVQNNEKWPGDWEQGRWGETQGESER